MTDAVGLFAGIRPFKNASEFGYTDYSPSMAQFDDKNNNVRNVAPGYNTPPSKTPREMEYTMYRSTLQQVLPQKGEPESVKFGKPMSDLNSHMYPHTGYARHQNVGLAFTQKPINGPIMPIAGFYDPDMLNVLGNLK